jgi:uncharacterized protein (DUF58 family)
MKVLNRITTWLEHHWVNPAYSGWLISGLALFFFGAATNTMAGWLYVISGVMIAIVAVAIFLPVQTLRGLKLRRLPIAPVSVGDSLVLELMVENSTLQPKTLLQLQDSLPAPFLPIRTAVEGIAPQDRFHWLAELPTQQRGVYHWQAVHLRTAAPLGLFWRRQTLHLPAKAVVYPIVLRLTQCPLIDNIGQENQQQLSSPAQVRLATEGVTRTLRPYRWGDSTRLIHWRSSARYGELRVRELETYRVGQEVVIGLDSADFWEPDCFEQAVVAAASLYFYALHHQLRVGLWTADTDLIHGDQLVLETLAGVQPQEMRRADLPRFPLLWLTQSAKSLAGLPAGSRWFLWQASQPEVGYGDGLSDNPGLPIQPDQPLQPQLQQLRSRVS